jgi:protein-S-isoprenylcysteine O-methyltransferase Ste14
MMNSAAAGVENTNSSWSVSAYLRFGIHQLLQLATRRRMRVTGIVFSILIVCDVLLWQTRPCNLLNPIDFATFAGEFLLLLGLALRSWAAGTLHKASEITSSGPYSLVRNPLYVGSFFMMLGFSILLRDWLATWIVLGPILAMYLNKVNQEERFLARCFPEAWSAYARRIPRFFPNFVQAPSFGGFSLAQWVHNREYQAVVATFLGLIAIWAWYAASA